MSDGFAFMPVIYGGSFSSQTRGGKFRVPHRLGNLHLPVVCPSISLITSKTEHLFTCGGDIRIYFQTLVWSPRCRGGNQRSIRCKEIDCSTPRVRDNLASPSLLRELHCIFQNDSTLHHMPQGNAEVAWQQLET